MVIATALFMQKVFNKVLAIVYFVTSMDTHSSLIVAIVGSHFRNDVTDNQKRVMLGFVRKSQL